MEPPPSIELDGIENGKLIDRIDQLEIGNMGKEVWLHDCQTHASPARFLIDPIVLLGLLGRRLCVSPNTA